MHGFTETSAVDQSQWQEHLAYCRRQMQQRQAEGRHDQARRWRGEIEAIEARMKAAQRSAGISLAQGGAA